MSISEIPRLVRSFYELTDELRRLIPGWQFTLDGKLVGDLGEALACYYFGLTPLPAGEKTHDARAPDGRRVQVKTTQGKVFGLGLERRHFEHLIALRINREGEAEVVYNGPGWRVWEELGEIKSCSIGVNRLRRLDAKVQETERVPRQNADPPLQRTLHVASCR